MTSSVSLKGKDFGGEHTRFGFSTTQMTSANFDAQITLIDAIQTAADNVSYGSFTGLQVSAVDDPVGSAETDEDAQRESKWRVSYDDDVNPLGKGSFEIPMADLSLLIAGSGDMDVSGGAGAALVTAIEAGVISRLGNAITITSIVHVGRNV